jgi:hypothetical protein
MKNSSKILIAAMVLAFVWTFAYGWMASTAINGYRAGKIPSYAHPVKMKAPETGKSDTTLHKK